MECTPNCDECRYHRKWSSRLRRLYYRLYDRFIAQPRRARAQRKRFLDFKKNLFAKYPEKAALFKSKRHG